MEVYGKVSGIGDSETRANEITADELATFRYYIIGWQYGIIDYGKKFDIKSRYTDTLIIDSGLMFAYGYLGLSPREATFTFNKTAAVQYHFIYAEIDKSVVPNKFKITTKNNQASPLIKPTTFRQDILSTVKTGVFQLPLYQVKITLSGISEVIDLRNDYKYFKNVKRSDDTKEVVGSISSSVTGTTQQASSNSLLVATTMHVHNSIRDYIDNDGGTIDPIWQVNQIRAVTSGTIVFIESPNILETSTINIDGIVYRFNIEDLQEDGSITSMYKDSDLTRTAIGGRRYIYRTNKDTYEYSYEEI